MSSKPSTFKKTDIRRAVQVARTLGPVAGFELSLDAKKLFVRFGEPLASDAVKESDDLDDVIARIRANGETRRAS